MQTHSKWSKIAAFYLILALLSPLLGSYTVIKDIAPNAITTEKAQETMAYMEQVASLNLFLERIDGQISSQEYELLEAYRQTLLIINTTIQDRYKQYLETIESHNSEKFLNKRKDLISKKIFLEDEITREESAFWEAYDAFVDALPRHMKHL